MPFKYDPNHPLFTHPPDDARLWRYLDFTKLVSLLETRSLFLSRADQMGDPFEGAVSPATIALREQLLDLADAEDPDQKAVQLGNLQRTIDDTARARRLDASFTYVSCWHVSEVESAGMWVQYVPSGHGVAVQTTFKRLEGVLPTEPVEGDHRLLYLGRVHYLDYQTDLVPEGNAYAPFICKRRSFEHEREVRLLCSDFPFTDDFDADFRRIPKEPLNGGVHVPVDLDKLIEAVYLRPETPSWISDVVRIQLERAGVSAPVIVSDLDQDPFF